MPIRFRCGYCQNPLSIGTRKARTATQCPTCSKDIIVPEVSDPALGGDRRDQETASHPEIALCPDVAPILEPACLAPAPPAPPATILVARPFAPPPAPKVERPPAAAPVATPVRLASLVRFFPPRQRALAACAAALLLLCVAAVLAYLAIPEGGFLKPRTRPPVLVAGLGDNPKPPPKVVPPAPLPEEPRPPTPQGKEKTSAGTIVTEGPKEATPAALSKARGPITAASKGGPAAPVAVVKPQPPAFTMKRRQHLDAEELRKQLLDAPEIALDSVPNTGRLIRQSAQARQRSRRGGVTPPLLDPAKLFAQRDDLRGLPLLMGKDCHLGKEQAEALHILSRKLRVAMQKATKRGDIDFRPDPDKLRAVLMDDARGSWTKAEAVPALTQMLQAENTPLRKLLVDLLARIDCKQASEALARRAMTDLVPAVRQRAVKALLKRPAEEYAHVLVEGLDYPWAPVADHAAEALAALGVKESIPAVIKLLDGPAAAGPRLVQRGNWTVPVVREVVRINHLSNCMLCHAPSTAQADLVRGAMPTPGQPLPAPATTPQYYQSGGIFVRADITYLKQDFSVMQPVENPHNWPAYQRFDYVVREREISRFDLAFRTRQRKKGSGPQKEAMLFVLRELTGKDLGTKAEDWLAVLPPGQRPKLSGRVRGFTAEGAERAEKKQR